jgi:hypothetical protein
MDQQYSVINQCLQLLKRCDLPTIKKLRVEIQLIQLKRLLLNDTISSEILLSSGGDEMFQGLLCQMRTISSGNDKADALSELMNQLSGMLTLLGGDQASN